MKEILGYKTYISDNTIVIYDSYKMTKDKIRSFVRVLKTNYKDNPVVSHMTESEIYEEIAAHNVMYKWIAALRYHTKDTDFNYPVKDLKFDFDIPVVGNQHFCINENKQRILFKIFSWFWF